MLRNLISLLHTDAITKTANFFFAIAALTLLTNSSTAQKSAVKKQITDTTYKTHSKFEIGLAGGLSLNQFTKGQPQTGLNTGYTGGFLVNYNLFKAFSLQIEANYLQQGGQLIRFKDDTRIGLEESFTNKNVKNSSYKLNSIEVPVLINYTIPLKQPWKPSFYIGGSYAYTFNVTENYQKTGNLLPGEDIIATVSDKQSVNGVFNKYRINVIAGGNVKLPLTSKLKLLLDFRYLTGLTAARENYSYMEKIGFGSDIRSNSFIARIGMIIAVD